MATITNRKGYHTLNWTDPNEINPKTGKPRRKRTSLGKVGTIPKRDLDAILKTKEYELSTGARLLNAHRRPAPRFDQFVRDYKLWHQGEFPDSTYRVQQIIDDHLTPWFGSTALNLISVQQAEDYKTRRKREVADQTLEKEIRVLFAVINRAIKLKHLQDNPIAVVEPPQILESKPHVWYDRDQLKTLYKQSGYGPIWRFLANTGLRRGESLILRRLWITDAVRIQSTGEERTKAGEWRKIPLTEGARKALERIKQDGPYVLPRMAPESLSRACSRDLKAAGLPGSLHSLRHSYICHLLLEDTPIRTVQLYAGHAHISTTEKYAYQVLNRDPARVLKMAI